MENLNNFFIRCTTNLIFEQSLLILNHYKPLGTKYENYSWKGKNSVLIVIDNTVYHDSKLVYHNCIEILFKDLVAKY